MAMNLRENIPKGDTLVVYDADIKKSQSLLKDALIDGANRTVTMIGTGPYDVAAKADTVFTALPAPIHVQSTFASVLNSPTPLPFPSSLSPRLFIDCSTIDPSTSRGIAAAVASIPHAGHFIDAPMSGGVVGAQAASLTFMMGHTPDPRYPDLKARAEVALLNMGAKVWNMGGQGNGVSAKLINNYMLAVSNVATAEAMHMGSKLGLDPAQLARMVASSTGRNWVNDVNNPVPGVCPNAPGSKGYDGGFGIGLMRKDLGLFEKGADEAGARLELLEKVLDVHEGAEEMFAGKDFSVVYEYLKLMETGVEEEPKEAAS
ncbi:hypothetical protein KEM55_006512 [Ascosphaera atra]|nr:hypothetical protein KEM55_006512 [Ascosphaera atra]